ncbi:MAG: malate synthase A, partial [Methanobacteriota archaeon]
TATAEIARSQIWQWLHHRVPLNDGPTLTREHVRELEDRELARIRTSMGDEAFSHSKFREARTLFDHIALGDDFVEFLTIPAYERID